MLTYQRASEILSGADAEPSEVKGLAELAVQHLENIVDAGTTDDHHVIEEIGVMLYKAYDAQSAMFSGHSGHERYRKRLERAEAQEAWQQRRTGFMGTIRSLGRPSQLRALADWEEANPRP